jgi:hypothetical protein
VAIKAAGLASFKGGDAMSVYETLSLMILFGTLIILLIQAK